MENITKRFDGKVALNHTQMELQKGEILGLVGDNGAGKSTLLKILAGVLKRDEGKIFINGHEVDIDTPFKARALGIEMVYQDLSLCGTLKIWENIFLGRYLTKRFLKIFPFLDRKRMEKESARVLKELGIDLSNINQTVRTLSGGQQQAVSFSRCLLFHPHIILLDEPMASMALWEREKILHFISQLREKGCSIVIVTHNLQDLFKVADRVLVLKEGRSIWCGPLSGMNPNDIAQLMFTGKK